MTDEKAPSIDILSEFGLTENQAKVFIATTQLENPTVAEVADAAEVRREEVYRLLPELEKFGLVERLLGKPLRLRSPDPKSSISTLVKLEKERARARISDLSMKSRELFQQLGQHSVEISDDEILLSEFSLIQEKESIRTELFDMISKSKEQIDILFSRVDLTWLLSTQGETLRSAMERGVKIRIMSNPPIGRDRLPKILQRRFPDNLEISLKYLLSPTAFFLITDLSQLLFITSGVRHLPASNCLWTNNDSLIALTHKDFEERWNESVYWKTIDGIEMAVSPQDGLEGGVSHVHRLFIYRSTDTKYKVLFNFLKERHEQGAMGFYVCSKDSMGDVNKAMIEFGFDRKSLGKDGNIRVLDWSEWLLDDGTFSTERAIDAWDDLYFQSQEKGFNGIAAATEMQFFFDHDMVERLEDYEEHIHGLLEGQMVFKCAYNEQTLLNTENPFQLYARLLGFHNTLLSEQKDKIERIRTRR